MSDPIRAAFEAHFSALPYMWDVGAFARYRPLTGPQWESYQAVRTQAAWVAWQASRAAALEEAAKACDDEALPDGTAQICAAHIRAMVKP